TGGGWADAAPRPPPAYSRRWRCSARRRSPTAGSSCRCIWPASRSRGVALWPLLWPAGAAAIAMLPLLGWSRLRMARHTLPEVLGGALLGLACGAVVVVLG